MQRLGQLCTAQEKILEVFYKQNFKKYPYEKKSLRKQLSLKQI